MKRGMLLLLVLLMGPLVTPAAAQTRFIVRTTLGLPSLQSTCLLLGCTVKYGLGDPQGQVFLVTTSSSIDPGSFLRTLRFQLGIVDAELDLLGKIQQATASGIPAALYDNTPVNYFGSSVWHGYVTQPASQIVRIADTQGAFNVRGSGIVAVIDTGVDPNHPAFDNVLVSGYDFTRNKDGASEMADLNQSTAAVVDQEKPAYVNQSTAAVVDQSTAAVVDNPQYAAFGHGTMVAGVVHLVAPKAMIMPLKSFSADGTGYMSDVLRAIYRSVQNNAKVINMSFSFAAYSQELNQAINFAGQKGVICVASVGNSGSNTIVYPAGFSNRVMGVASTTNDDTRSTFSNYGAGMVWVAAPGEGIVTTYPFGTYAAAWGTSFSAPFVSGSAALLLDVKATCSESQAAKAVANAKWISYDLGNGRLDLYQAVQAWRQTLGLQ